MTKRASFFALTLLALSFASQAKADFTVTLSGLNPTTLSSNGTQFLFTIPQAVQNGFDGFTQPFNVINVAEPTASSQGSASATLTENFSITDGVRTLTGTLTGTFTISGATSTFTNTSITNLVGSGFTVNTINYAQPSIGSQPNSITSGNISFQVTPTAVPEPASVAMLGMGLVGVGFAARRRLAK